MKHIISTLIILFFSTACFATLQQTYTVEQAAFILQQNTQTLFLSQTDLSLSIRKRSEQSILIADLGISVLPLTSDTSTIFSTEQVTLLPHIEKLLLKLPYTDGLLIIGKQPLRWGSGSAFSPANLFHLNQYQNPFGKLSGIPALKWQHYLSDLSYIEVLYAAPSLSLDTAGTLRRQGWGVIASQLNWSQFSSDIYLGGMAVPSTQHLYPTLALKGDTFFSLGYHLEGVAALDLGSRSPSETLQTKWAFGLDGHLHSSLTWLFEVFYQTSTTPFSLSTQGALETALTHNGYYLVNLNWMPETFISYAFYAIGNPNDGSILASISATLPVNDDISCTSILQKPLGGSGTEFSDSEQPFSTLGRIVLSWSF